MHKEVFYLKKISRIKVIVLMLTIIIVGIVSKELVNSNKAPEFKPQIYNYEALSNLNGYFFITTNYTGGIAGDPYIAILDNHLNTVWYQKLPEPYTAACDFKKHPNGKYSYWRGTGNINGSAGEFVILNSEKQIEKIVKIKNHNNTDAHEFIFKPNGNYMMLCYDVDEYAKQVNAVIQEQDMEGNVVWEWDSGKYFTREISSFIDINKEGNSSPSTQEPILNKIYAAWKDLKNYNDWSIRFISLKYRFKKTVAMFLGLDIPKRPTILEKPQYDDIVHSNSIFVCNDGNILLSSRHLNTVTKINYKTGKIIWNLGGQQSKLNQFTFVNDTQNGFSAQHDARFLPNGDLLLFDNGNLNNPQLSRAVEYKLDEVNKTAELVWEYRNVTEDGYTYGGACGSARKIPNELVLIGWGLVKQAKSQPPAFSIVKTNKEKVADFFMPIKGEFTYRVQYSDSL